LKRISFWIALPALGCLLLGCGSWPWDMTAGGGSGTETTGGGKVFGSLVYPDGSPGARVAVFARSDTYLRDTSETGSDSTDPDTFTDRNGHFLIDSLALGRYVLETRDKCGRGVAIRFEVLPERKEIQLQRTTLYPVGGLEGRVELSELPHSHAFIQVYGLERVVRTDSLGFFSLPDLPIGQYRIRAVSSVTEERYEEVAQAAVVSGDTMRLPIMELLADYSQWAYSLTIHLNTTSAGADVPGSVRDFPLLVRLNKDNFEFSQARTDGRDLRVADRDGKPLAFEIEDWDRQGAQASIWIGLDSVNGDDSSQFIRLYWGNPAALPPSPDAGVFSPAKGYQGVWHLNEIGNSRSEGYRDATGNGNHGQGTAMDTTATAVGAIGHGQVFNGYTSAINAGTGRTLHAYDGLTLEMWVKVDSFQEHANLISKSFSTEQYPYYEFGFTLGHGNNFRFAVTTADTINKDIYTTRSAVANEWYHLVGVFDGSQMRVFINGVPTDSLALSGTLADFDRPLMLGRYEHVASLTLHGILDEARVSDVARSASYIKLCYESQKLGGRLLRYVPK
jgi:hypothetical protein